MVIKVRIVTSGMVSAGKGQKGFILVLEMFHYLDLCGGYTDNYICKISINTLMITAVYYMSVISQLKFYRKNAQDTKE